MTYATTSDVFAVNRDTGRITTLQPLDREVVPVYSITVVATDSGITTRFVRAPSNGLFTKF